MDEKELLELKKKIDEAKTQLAELKGTQKHLMSELKKDWDCNTVEEAGIKAQKMQKDIDKLNTTIQEGVKELEENYDIVN